MQFTSVADNEAIRQTRDSVVRSENRDIRAKMLQDIYVRKRKGEETHADPKYFASLLGIDESLANFNLEYLVGSRLLDGNIVPLLGTTKKLVLAWDITHLGMRAVEGSSQGGFDVNFQMININAPVTQSNIAAGHNIDQTQTINIESFAELYKYIDNKFEGFQKSTLKPLIQELEAEVNSGSVKTGTITKIKETIKTWGPIVIPIIQALPKLVGF